MITIFILCHLLTLLLAQNCLVSPQVVGFGNYQGLPPGEFPTTWQAAGFTVNFQQTYSLSGNCGNNLSSSTQDGSISGRVSTSYSGCCNRLLGGVGIRESISTGSKGVQITQKTESGSFEIAHRTGGSCWNEINGNLQFNGQGGPPSQYYAYIKLERIGAQVHASVSDDDQTWNRLFTFSLSSPTVPVWYGFLVGSEQNNLGPVSLTNTRISGFGLPCSGSMACRYNNQNNPCVPDPASTLIECGANTWRYVILHDQQLYSPSPIIASITTNQITHQSQLDNMVGSGTPGQDANYVFFKKVIGTGSVVIKGMVSTLDAQIGVMFRDSMIQTGMQLSKRRMFGCFVVPEKNILKSYIRQLSGSTNGNSQNVAVSYNPNSILRANRTGSTWTCEYSSNGITWFATQPLSHPDLCVGFDCYAGISGAQYQGGDVHTFNDVSFVGFQGYCNNRSSSCGTVGGVMDQCVCSPAGGYIGQFCEQLACYGISAAASTSVCTGGNGICIGPNQCSCYANWGGTQCEIPACGGILATFPTVCSSSGTCLGPNQCNCIPGKTGSTCQFNICYGISGGSIAVCSTRGSCIAPNTCSCNAGYTGNQCETPICFSKAATDPTVCSEKGSCTGPNICSCSAGYGAPDCSNSICYGILSSSTSVCSTKGTCTAPNTCLCQTGYGLSNCSVPICYNKFSTDVNVCSSRGACTAPNTCVCQTGYGSSDCSQPLCASKLSSDPTVCSGRGTCVAPNTCVCQNGWVGSTCSVPVCFGIFGNNTSVCSSKGTCTAPDTCSCQAGYGTSNCALPICNGLLSNNPLVCTARGTCSTPNNCVCQSGYSGGTCQWINCFSFNTSSPSQVCSGNGTCTSPNNCLCNSGFVGNQCQIPTCFGKMANETSVCSGKGSCFTPSVCTCQSGYTNTQCQDPICFGLQSSNPAVCSARGSCISPNNCSCPSGWHGSTCTSFNCLAVGNCNSHGTCVGANQCSCSAGWTGADCNIPICFGTNATVPTVCTGKGTCVAPNNCTCISSGYFGSQCELTNCLVALNCSSNGLCVGPNNCSCFEGWRGFGCNIFHCDLVNNCSSRGTCVGAGQCACQLQWSGPDCTAPVCFGQSSLNPLVCSGQGNCTSPNNCVCKPDNIGTNCSIPVCFGRNANESLVCSSHGTCAFENTCVCQPGFSGSNCQFNLCSGISSDLPNVCSGHGNCTAPNTCSCSTGWTGNDCQTPICYGNPATSTFSCTGSLRGVCSSPNNCTCSQGYTGSECQFNLCFGVSNSSSQVCSGVGSCVAPDSCQCPLEYYGTTCQRSYFGDLMSQLCPTCLLNTTTWSSCIHSGPSCVCSQNSEIQSPNSRILCNAQNHITSIRINYANLTGPLTSMVNLTKLTSLDLSYNQIQIPTLASSLLPTEFQTLNLTSNQISTAATNFQIKTGLTSLILDSNAICGIYPLEWISRSYSLSLVNHAKLFACTSVNSQVCTPIQMMSAITVLPHETEMILNYTSDIPTSCQGFLTQSNVKCKSYNLAASQHLYSSFLESNVNSKLIKCSRSALLTAIDQWISLDWTYNSTMNETISTPIRVSNLPYISLATIDRTLVASNGIGSQIVTITANQNTTLYKKIPSHNIKCSIEENGVFVVATPLNIAGTSVQCNLPLLTPNETIKSLFLYDDSQMNKISSNLLNFYFIAAEIVEKTVYSSQIINLQLKRTSGSLIPAISGQAYSLKNPINNINIPCSTSVGFIINCTKSTSWNYTGDINLLALEFWDTNVKITNIDILSYRLNSISIWSPLSTFSTPQGNPQDITFAMNQSTFSSPLNGILYYAKSVGDNTKYNVSVLNNLSGKFRFNATSSGTLSFYIYALVPGYAEVVLNENPLLLHTNLLSVISPASSLNLISGTNQVVFTYTGSVSPLMTPYLECRFAGNQSFKAYHFGSDFYCNVTTSVSQNMTFWYKESGFSYTISSNSIEITVFEIGTIQFHSSSQRLGLVGQANSFVVSFNQARIPSTFSSRILCQHNNLLLPASLVSTSTFSCTNSQATPSIGNITMMVRFPNSFKVNGVLDTFRFKTDLTLYASGSTGSYVDVPFETVFKIASGEALNTCSDIIVTYKGIQIPRLLIGCNTAGSKIYFNVQQNILLNSTDYAILYGNTLATSPPTTVNTISLLPTTIVSNSVAEPIFVLSNNTLNYVYVATTTIASSDPTACITTSCQVNLATNYQNLPPQGIPLVEYEVRGAFGNVSAVLTTGNTFSSTLSSGGASQTFNVGIYAVLRSTRESKLVSNIFPFPFVSSLTLLDMVPFVDRYAVVGSSRNNTVRVSVSAPFLITQGLLCKFDFAGITTFSNFVPTTASSGDCLMLVNNLNSNVEFVQVALFMNVSSNATLNFVLTGNPINFVFVREPVQFEFPSYLIASDVGRFFSLNMSNPALVSTLITRSTLELTQDIQPNPNQILNCTYTGSKPQCKIEEMSVSHTPMKFNFVLSLQSASQQIVNFTLSPVWFIENLTVISETPVVINPIDTPSITFKLRFNKNLNNLFLYFCNVYDSQIIGTLTQPNEISCVFDPRIREENLTVIANIAPNVFSTTSIEIGRSQDVIQSSFLMFSPFFAVTQSPSQHVVVRDSGNPQYVPRKYQSYQFRAISYGDGENIVMPCNVTSDTWRCTKPTFAYQRTTDIAFLRFKMQVFGGSASWEDVSAMNTTSMMTYKINSLSRISPMAALLGSNITLQLIMTSNTYRRQLNHPLQFWCGANNNTYRFPATFAGQLVINTTIQYSLHNQTSLDLTPMFLMPALSPTYFELANAPKLLTYLSPGPVRLLSNQVTLFTTGKTSQVLLNLTTAISATLRVNLRCRLNDGSGFALATVVNSSNGIDHTLNCTFLTTISGKKAISVWYVESSLQFELTSNSQEIVFVNPGVIITYSPNAIVANFTNRFTISTSYSFVDYGQNITYACKFGLNNTRSSNSSVASQTEFSGVFTCPLEWPRLGDQLFLSIWAQLFGTEIKITGSEPALSTVSSNFLTPSYGTPNGGEIVQINNYQGVTSNITFQNLAWYKTYTFTCNLTVQGALKCTTPKIPLAVIPLYSSQFLIFFVNNFTLSSEYIYHERRTIMNHNPKVVPMSATSYSMNLMMDKAVTTSEGSFFVVLAGKTDFEVSFNLGSMTNTQNITTTLAALAVAGSNSLELYYYNPNSFEFRSMFSISPQVPVTFVNTAPIIISQGKNVIYVNQVANVTISLTANVGLTTLQSQSVRCLLADVQITTYYVSPTSWICQVSSNSTRIAQLSLAYINSDAHSGLVVISSASLDVLFIQIVSTTSIVPFASLETSQSVSIQTNISSDIYGIAAQYQCLFNGTFSPASLSGTTISCVISKGSYPAYTSSVFLRLQSIATGDSLLWSMGTPFSFLDTVEIHNVTPFAVQGFITTPISLSLQVKSNLLVNQGLFCKFTSSNSITYESAILQGLNVVKCSLSKSNFTQQVEFVTISISLNASTTSFDLSSNNETFYYFKDPLDFYPTSVFKDVNMIGLALSIPVPNSLSWTANYNIQPGSTSQVAMNCSIGPSSSCTLPDSQISIFLYSPTVLNISLTATHLSSGVSISLKLTDLVYYKSSTVEHVKPFIFSHVEKISSVNRLVMNINKKVNPKIKYQCKVNQGQVSNTFPVSMTLFNNEYQQSIDPQTHLVCLMNSFGSIGKFNVTLQFQVDSTIFDLTLNQGRIESRSIENLPSYYGPAIGGAKISLSSFTYTLPTDTFTDYNISLKLYDRGVYIDLISCQPPFENCELPNIVSLFDANTFSKKIRVDLVINKVRALPFSPYFTFYNNLKSSTVQPSRYLMYGQPYSLTFVTKNLETIGGSLTLNIVSQFENIFTSCSIVSKNTFKCDQVTFNAATISNLFISMDSGTSFSPFDDILISYGNIGPTQVSTTTFSPAMATTVWFYGNAFINSTDIKVRLLDDTFNMVVDGQYWNNTHISAIVTPIYDKNIFTPRNMKLALSLDAGQNYFAPFDVIVEELKKLIVLPSLIPINTMLDNIQLVNFPSNGVSIMDSTNLLRIRLISTQGHAIRLNCILPSALCSMLDVAVNLTSYSLTIDLTNEHQNISIPTYFRSDPINTHALINNPSSLNAKSFIKFSLNRLRIFGNYDSYSRVSVGFGALAGPLATLLPFSTANIIFGVGLDVSLPSSITAGNKRIHLSLNDGFSWQPTNFSINVLENYEIFEVTNPDNVKNPTFFFTFLRSNVTISGVNLIDSGDVKLTLNNSNILVDITTVSPIAWINPTSIKFVAPTIEMLNLTYSVRFPLILSVGLSLNDGLDTKYGTLTYVDSYPFPTFTGLLPQITIRQPLNVTLYGLNLELVQSVAVYDSYNTTEGAELSQQKPLLLSANSLMIAIPQFPENINRTVYYVRNQQGQRAPESYQMFYYKVPIASKIIPDNGPTYGGYSVVITVENLVSPNDISTIYCKFGNIACPNDCKFSSLTEITCLIPAVPPGEATVSLSYNKLDWHPTTIDFKFVPCLAGYGAPNYQTRCALCPPGTYKPTDGVYSCFTCGSDTYTQLSGSNSCDKCPQNTTTNGIVGATSHKDCVCEVGYYINPNTEQVTNAFGKCIDCPWGGDCSTRNTTIPLAKPGFWYDTTRFDNFAECKPLGACPGGGFANCTLGYSGPRCGYCSRNYYKQSGFCYSCGAIGFSWIKLIVLVGAFIPVVVGFFLISTYFPSLLTSVSITLQYWQVLSLIAKFDFEWPSFIQNSLSVSSVSNVQFDIFSPSCIFPDFNFLTLWFLQMGLPLYFLILFGFLYLFGEIRSFWAGTVGRWYTKLLGWKYMTPNTYETSDDEAAGKKSHKQRDKDRKPIEKMNRTLWWKNQLIWLRNSFIWMQRQPSSRRDLTILFNKCLNSYSAFISFIFITVMTNASVAFACTRQADGNFTLDASPDILCFQSPQWWIMLPFTLLMYIVFGGGILLYFGVMIIQVKKGLGDSVYFAERFRFILLRFKKRYFYWKIVETVRNLVISIAFIFFKPMLVLVCGLLTMFVSTLLHLHHVPFMRKFHNIMEYFVLLSVLLTFFMSTLFFVDKWPSEEFKTFCAVLTIAIIVVCNVIAIGMTLWDVFVRQRNIGKRAKEKRIQRRAEKTLVSKEKRVVNDVHGFEVPYITSKTPLPFDTEFDFHYIWRELNISSEDEQDQTMNDMLFNIISWKRLKKNLGFVKKLGDKIKQKVKKNNISLRMTKQDIGQNVETQKRDRNKTVLISSTKL